MSASAVSRTNEALVRLLESEGIRIAGLEVCLHHPEGGVGGDPELTRVCDCRKPKPGMLRTLMGRLEGDEGRSWMIGDGAGDLEAGRAIGLRTALVFATNRCELCPLREGPGTLAPDVHGATLLEVARAILHHA
jgi:D-glycero-D-manno-heptose 1,7-bisphosphate phosphatase